MFTTLYGRGVGGTTDRAEVEVARRISVDRVSRVPLAAQISRQLTWLIATGALEAGAFLPPISDLATQVGVNTHTMRAAYGQLRDDGLVRMRRGSRTMVLGFDRRRAAHARERHHSFSIGVLIPSFAAYYDDFLAAVTGAAGAEGWLPIICETHHFDAPVVSSYLDQLFSRNVDGLIAIHAESPSESEAVDLFGPSDTLRPLVLVDSADLATSSQVDVDRETDGRVATAHLIEHGHRRIGAVMGPASWISTRRLLGGHSLALASADLTFVDDHVANVPDHTLEAGSAAARRLLALDEGPTAIVCAGDIVALGVIHGIRAAGLRVPEDVAVIGYGDIPFAAASSPTLTTIRLPAAELGHEAVRMLRRAIDEGGPQPPTTVATSLVLRHSCGCPSNRVTESRMD